MTMWRTKRPPKTPLWSVSSQCWLLCSFWPAVAAHGDAFIGELWSLAVKVRRDR